MELTVESIIDEIANECHEIAKSKGFWKEDRNNGELIALMHSELSEALESLRKRDREADEHCPKFNNTEIEFADCIIRIFDFCAARGLRIGGAITEKMRYNKRREYKHGKQF